MTTTTLPADFTTPRDDNRVDALVSALEAPYVEATVRPEVKVKIDRTIERYGMFKSLLELHALSLPLCLGLADTEPDRRDDTKRTQ